jgi:hypothetical protein
MSVFQLSELDVLRFPFRSANSQEPSGSISHWTTDNPNGERKTPSSENGKRLTCRARLYGLRRRHIASTPQFEPILLYLSGVCAGPE